jgi:hypothetical protein
MDARQQRGMEIAATKRLRQKGALWLVPSQAGGSTYIVDPTEKKPTCTCPDFETRQASCKHVYAVEFALKRETIAPDGYSVTESVRVTYRQEWTAYNAAQVNEKERVALLLSDLCSAIDNPVQKRGRPRLPLADATFCAVMKVYGGTSARRASSDLRDFADKGYIDRAPHYNSVLNALENPELTPILTRLIEESATPLRALETDFAMDSSGFAVADYHRWFSAKYGREMTKTKWLKAHIMVGTRTNVVTAVKVTDNYGPEAQDTLHLPALLDASVQRGLGRRDAVGGQGVFDEAQPSGDRTGAGVPAHPIQGELGSLPRERRRGGTLAPDVFLLHVSPRGVPLALPPPVERRDDVPHDQVQVRTPAALEDGGRAGERTSVQGALP